MPDMRGFVAPRLILPGALLLGWLIGLVGQRSIVEATGYLDISPPLLALGCGLCALAGVAARVLATAPRRLRDGARAGIAMMAAMVAGYIVLTVAYRDRFDPEASGETWFSLLLEAWFWIGVPVFLSAALGSLGWLTAGAFEHRGRHPSRRV